MRELKFRAWDGDRYWYNIVPSPIRSRTIDICKEITSHEPEYWNMVDVIEGVEAVEQYTGLKDKNGKEIYEGDILGDMWRDGYIAWCDKCKQLQYHILTHECMACLGDVQWYELVNDNGKLEVVGNVHENPDLLERK